MVALIGVTYLSRSSIMPYHLDALGTTWDALDPAYRALYLAFFKGVGAGYLAAGLAASIMVFGPMRRGAGWTLWAVPLVVCVAMGPLTGIILYVRAETPAEPPLVYPLLVMGLSGLAALLSLVGRRAAD